METMSEVLRELIGRGFEDIKIGTAMGARCRDLLGSAGLDVTARPRGHEPVRGGADPS